MNSRPLSWYLVVCCLLLPALGVTFPGSDSSRAADQKDAAPIQDHKINLGKLDLEIRSHLDKIRKSGEQEVNLLDELKHVDDKLSTQKQKLATLQERLHTQEELLPLKKQDILQAEQAKENVRLHLEKRLRSFYLMGKTGFLNVTFSKQSLPDLMLFNDSYKQLLEYDQSVIDMYRETIDQLTRAKEALELEKTLLQDFIQQTKKEKQTLDNIRTEKQQLLALIRSRKGLYEQAVREMQRAEFALTKTLTELKQKEEKRVRGFVLNKGNMAGPVIGNLVVRFGDPLENGPSNGITIDTADKEQVFSIYAGKVIFAGYKYGYGSMVIIDHGLQYYTITARLDEITVKEGDQVQTQSQIGTTGEIATLFSKGLHFEIRQGSKPLDPLQWLQNNYYPQLIPLPVPAVQSIPESNTPLEEDTSPPE